MLVSVEKPSSRYEWPETNTVTAASRPSGARRTRLGTPCRGSRCSGSNAPSNTMIACVV